MKSKVRVQLSPSSSVRFKNYTVLFPCFIIHCIKYDMFFLSNSFSFFPQNSPYINQLQYDLFTKVYWVFCCEEFVVFFNITVEVCFLLMRESNLLVERNNLKYKVERIIQYTNKYSLDWFN